MSNSLLLGLVACLTFSVVACTRGAQYYHDSGNKLFAQGKYADASLNYRKAILKDVKYGEAYYRLALAELHLGKTGEAYQDLVRAAELLPTREDVQVKMADLSLAGYLADSHRSKVLYDRATSVSDKLLTKDAHSYDAMRLKGSLAMAERRFGDAEKFFRQANEARPMQPDVIMSWTQVLLQDNQPAEAERLAAEFIAKNKTYGLIYDVLYGHYLSFNQLADAERILKKRVENNPTDARAAMQLATFYAAHSRPDEMKIVLQRMLDNPKDFPQAHLLAGDLYDRMQRWEDAIQEYEAGGKADPKAKIVYLKRITDVWLAQGRGEKASELITEILKEQPNDDAAEAVKASLMLSSGNPENIAKAVSKFQTLADKSPDNPVWHFNLGRALAAHGELAGAATQFQETIKRRKDFVPAHTALAQLSQGRGDYKSALRYADEILSVNPKLPGVRVLRAIALMNTGKETEARAELTNLEKAFPQYQEVQLQLAVLALKQKNFKEAEDRFRKVSQDNPGNARAMGGLVETYGSESQLAKALPLVEGELKKAPNSDALRALLAETAVRLGKYSVAIEQYQYLLTKQPKSEQLHLALGSVYKLMGDFRDAVDELRGAVRLAPQDPVPATLLGEALTLSGKKEAAIDAYRNALELKADNAPVMNNLAFLLAESGKNLEEALKLAQKAVEELPQQPDFSDTLGWIYLKKNLNDSAIGVFRMLTKRYPENPNYRYHLGAALLQKGERVAARIELETALSKKPPAEVRHEIESALAKTS